MGKKKLILEQLRRPILWKGNSAYVLFCVSHCLNNVRIFWLNYSITGPLF